MLKRFWSWLVNTPAPRPMVADGTLVLDTRGGDLRLMAVESYFHV